MSISSSASACIGLGSNLGQSRTLLKEAWQSLGQHPEVSLQALSSPYHTKPVGMESSHWFINAAGCLQTTLPPETLLDLLLETEQKFGRVRHPELEGYQDRTLDLDLLLFDSYVIQTDRLELPHPLMHERLFVLIPLAEIGTQLAHPLLQKTIAELLAEQEAKKQNGREGIEQASW
ncbi:MAG: 2-amino-4-hydroxy-6-hydroxymethyldihydropteridine diphosphokinase [Candidatus Electrothrix sp. AX5]|jgi:2-amino-4-hydroxy-6-hydroxymethyldihydropteridine diphosphokinase|uniref:2-amino-4-hydroxy-6-hydroxymethyldihydropteridine pyrophosphokinase n=1 Tax=Candidatus Electrothrix aarhusensis TaxID=1859131 RepID=A0A3S3QEG3_9BACT|nr:2-amino-4-hydroxy-6-hydroxymethyldihydropteridine diphosphokinase [Candidatus Electrothrix sp. AX5]RWX45356.1 2-amino-4-hydroxy-6-hydroxymethyldihydropteridine diphosphokinase [Candidatus Electrothrix aarhusensis]